MNLLLRMPSSWVCRYVVWKTDPRVSEDVSTSILRVEQESAPGMKVICTGYNWMLIQNLRIASGAKGDNFQLGTCAGKCLFHVYISIDPWLSLVNPRALVTDMPHIENFHFRFHKSLLAVLCVYCWFWNCSDATGSSTHSQRCALCLLQAAIIRAIISSSVSTGVSYLRLEVITKWRSTDADFPV